MNDFSKTPSKATIPDKSPCGNTRFPRHTSLILNSSYVDNNTATTVTQAEAEALEQATVHQAKCELWHRSRKHRLTASQFGRVVMRKKDVNTKFLTSLCSSQIIQSEAVTYGKNMKVLPRRLI